MKRNQDRRYIVKHYKEKLIIVGQLAGIQGDLEMRIEVLKGNFVLSETKDERQKTIENHIKTLKLTKDFLYELWDDYFKLLKEKEERAKAGLF